eukprot:1848868-Rhodomonas_salina.1
MSECRPGRSRSRWRPTLSFRSCPCDPWPAEGAPRESASRIVTCTHPTQNRTCRGAESVGQWLEHVGHGVRPQGARGRVPGRWPQAACRSTSTGAGV